MLPIPNADHHANRLLAAVAPEDFTLLGPALDLVELTRGQVLYEPGDAMSYIYFPHDAIISLVNLMEDGSIVEVGVFGREGAAGLYGTLNARKSFGRYMVQLPGTASRMAYRHMDEVRSARPRLKELLTNYAEALLAQSFQTISCNAVHELEARCCRWILSVRDRVGQDDLPLTHEFLAEMLGVERPAVSIVARKLQTAGLIRQRRGCITVMDRSSLEKTACECYGKIRDIYERLLPGTYPRDPSQ